jgi:hypothetical protein
MAGNLTSPATIVQKISMLSYTVSWAGTSPVGTLAVQISNDFSLNPNGTVNNMGTWTVLPLNLAGTTVNTIPVTGNTGTGAIDIDQLGFFAVQLVYTATSGTGVLNAVFNGKVS